MKHIKTVLSGLIRPLAAGLLFVFLAGAAHADLADKLIEKKYTKIIKPYSSERYIGTLVTKEDRLEIVFEADTGYLPAIMAYTIAENEINLIIKSRQLEPAHRECSSQYWRIRLFAENDEIQYECYWLEDPYLVTGSYTFAEGTINERFVNVRREPSTKSGIYCKLNLKSGIKITTVGKAYSKIARMYDNWLEAEINEKKYWIFGYYVDFPQQMPLRN